MAGHGFRRPGTIVCGLSITPLTSWALLSRVVFRGVTFQRPLTDWAIPRPAPQQALDHGQDCQQRFQMRPDSRGGPGQGALTGSQPAPEDF